MTLVRAMRMRPALRALRVLGCEANAGRVTLHLRPDTPLDPGAIMRLVQKLGSPWSLTSSMRLSKRLDPEGPGDSIDRVVRVVDELWDLRKLDA